MGCGGSKNEFGVVQTSATRTKTTTPAATTPEELWHKACDNFVGRNGVERDTKRGWELLQQAADAGHGEAMYNVGVHWENGPPAFCAPRRDPAKAVECYRVAADKYGDVQAAKALGYCYEVGVGGLEVDYEKAFGYYTRAADAGLAAGIYSVGYCYQKGHGVEQDEGKAVEMYRRASKMGFYDAHRALGFCYRFGIGVEQPNLQKAVEYYSKGAAAGSPYAAHNLAVMYEKGEGVDGPDLIRAMELFEQAGLEESKQRLEALKKLQQLEEQ